MPTLGKDPVVSQQPKFPNTRKFFNYQSRKTENPHLLGDFVCQTAYIQTPLEQPFLRGIEMKKRDACSTPAAKLLYSAFTASELDKARSILQEATLTAFLVDPSKAPLVDAYTNVFRERMVSIVQSRPHCEELADIVKSCCPLLLLYIGTQICPELTSASANRMPFCVEARLVHLLYALLPLLIKRWSLQEVLGTSLAKFLQSLPHDAGLRLLQLLKAKLELTDSFAGGNAEVLCQELELKCAQDPDANDICISLLKAPLPQRHLFFTKGDLTNAMQQYKHVRVPDIALAWPQANPAEPPPSRE